MEYLLSSLNTLRGEEALVAADPHSSTPDDVKKTPNPLTYPLSTKPFSKALFKDPTSEYRGAPFWAWNCKLEKGLLLREIDYFKEMGFGGFHMHVRTGLDTEYMGTEFMDLIRTCVEHAESKDMLACLYDEDRWPSGSCGGKVTQEYPEYKAKHILFTPRYYGTVPLNSKPESSSTKAKACRSENGHLLASYEIELDESGSLKSSRQLKANETGKNVWYAYLESNPGEPWYNDQTYIDTLSPKAMAKFIQSTHEKYKAKVGDKFGTVVPCIFTDEPQFLPKTRLPDPRSQNDVFFPWTPDFADTFEKQYSGDIVKHLPELVWNLPGGKASVIRYQYHDHSTERFVSAFMDQLADWCGKNGLMLDGHMMEEPRLESQTSAIGEAMRAYRNMQMPGMDLLCDWVEYNTAKQVTSVARQNGCRGAMTEIYGVTHWYFTFEGHKGSGDWQAALGITFRVHHLCWVSMAGEGKRDYPACIGYQSPWYKEYGYVEGHFARVAVAMTRGFAVTRVGVIHPIESYWLAFGPNNMGDELWRREQAFADLTHWLLHGLIDFDFISESLLPGQYAGPSKGKTLQVGKCEYDVIVVPNLGTIRSTTLKILNDFSKAGGKVIVMGNGPNYVDAKLSSSGPVLTQAEHVFWGEGPILITLDKYREIRILTDWGAMTNQLLYQMRQDGDERFVFICNTDRSLPIDTTICLKGYWDVELLDTLSGEESPIKSKANDGWTRFPHRFEGCASVLLRLSPFTGAHCIDDLIICKHVDQTTSDLSLKNIELSEPNALILDYAEYSFTNEPFEQRTEILRIDNILRARLSIPRKGAQWRQPWSIPTVDRLSRGQLKLRFAFESSFDISESTMLALEDASDISITLNDIDIPSSSPKGWWVDEAIKTVSIPGNTIKKGTNILLVSRPYGLLTNLERVYLLGNFAVELHGHDTVLKPFSVSNLSWGNITPQGLPFYVGNVTYNCDFTIPEPSSSPAPNSKSKSTVTLRVPNFSTPVLAVHDTKTGKKLGRIAFQPHTLSLGSLKPGKHQISITAFGNRYNSFGHIHLADGRTDQCWPDMWRTDGDWWTDDYTVKPIGVLDPPSLTIETSEVVESKKRLSQEWVLVKREVV